MQFNHNKSDMFLSVLKRIILMLENTFNDLKIRDQKKAVQKFIQNL